MMRAFQRSLLAAFGLAVTLSACSAGSLFERLPESMGGLPAGVPARPVAPYQYPAVHDMPPARSTEPLDDDQQLKLEKELRAARDRQEAPEGQADKGAPAKKAASTASKKTVAPAKKPSGDVIVVPPASAKTSGAKINP